MKSFEAIQMSKLKRKSAPMETATAPKEIPIVETLDVQQEDSGMPTAKKGSSLDILKATRATGVKTPTIRTGGFPSLSADLAPKKKKLEGEVDFGPTEVQGYSPIKNYLKKGR